MNKSPKAFPWEGKGDRKAVDEVSFYEDNVLWGAVILNQENNSLLTSNAQKLRKNMTKEERKLWYDCLKKLPFTINRQKVVGRYILDFYCASAKTAIELDGSQHYEEGAQNRDIERDRYLNERGIQVLRYSNRDINCQFQIVCEDIDRHLRQR